MTKLIVTLMMASLSFTAVRACKFMSDASARPEVKAKICRLGTSC